MPMTTQLPKSNWLTLFWDIRFWKILGQVLFVVGIVWIAAMLWNNLTLNLQKAGIQVGFDFLNAQASFDIGESVIAYSPTDTYGRAILVGLVNTLRITGIGIVLATIVGLIVGIARLSDNWLVQRLAIVYVEIFRNTPLLLQLFFWYFTVFAKLSQGGQPISWLKLSPEFAATLTGLTLFIGSFIAEIVRAGIQSVPKGQWEAARALGLKPAVILRRVVLPQALRVSVPPMTSQYLYLAKGCSLAIAIGYPDVYLIANTTFNQTGHAVEVMIILMAVYLGLDLMIAVSMNLFNRAVQIKER
jgi:general L-amino acid transport system permease protein